MEHIFNLLKPDECVVLRDFVDYHNVYGVKVNNLVIVHIQRHEDEILLCSKISIFCSDHETRLCVKDIVEDVFQFHLAPEGEHGNGLFDIFTTIYFLLGNHGPHFSSKKTLHNESTMTLRYGKKFHDNFFMQLSLLQFL